MKALGLKVHRALGDKAIQVVTRLGLMDKGLRITEIGSHLLIPLVRSPREGEVQQCRDVLHHVEVVMSTFPKKTRSVTTLEAALRNVLPPHLIPSIPRALDTVGRVAILEVAPELQAWKHVIGDAVMQVNKHVKTVLAKAGRVGGEYRLRPLEVIAGTGDTTTTHREYGCVYHLDPMAVYFSPRLSEERRRVAGQVQAGETVVDMFASVGPFSIQIGKTQPDVKVFAVDHNAEAVHFLRKNIRVNHVAGTVVPVQGDIRCLANRLQGRADRVIMDLPERAAEFIDVACRLLKPKDSVIHFYCFESEPSPLLKAAHLLEKRVVAFNRRLHEIFHKRCVRQVAPHTWHVVIDGLVC